MRPLAQPKIREDGQENEFKIPLSRFRPGIMSDHALVLPPSSLPMSKIYGEAPYL
jgi:hypothetical protein